jgi:hypothetical protein
LRYRHLAFAIWTDFRSRHYGVCQVDGHDASFRPIKCRGEQKAHPGLGACQSEKQELELARSLCASGSITNMVRLLSTRVEEKLRLLPDGRLAKAAKSLAPVLLRLPEVRRTRRLVAALVSRSRRPPGESERPFKGIICRDISEFESHMPSQAVRSPSAKM